MFDFLLCGLGMATVYVYVKVEDHVLRPKLTKTWDSSILKSKE